MVGIILIFSGYFWLLVEIYWYFLLFFGEIGVNVIVCLLLEKVVVWEFIFGNGWLFLV